MTSRRRFLRAGASLALGLPLLPSLGFAGAAASQATRLVLIIGNNGVVPEDWFPAEVGNAFTLPFSLEPLAPWHDQLAVIHGLHNESAKLQEGNGHTRAGAHILTCSPHIPGQFTTAGGGGFSTGISFDQWLAQEVASDVPLPSLLTGYDIGNGGNGQTPRWRMSHLGYNQPIQPEGDPLLVYNKLTGFLANDKSAAAELVTLQRERRSVLDLAMGDIAALQPELSAVDRQRLDRHLTHLRTVEQRIASAPAPTSCGAGDAPFDSSEIVEATETMRDLLGVGLGCGLTKVTTFQWGGCQNQIRMDWLDGVDTTLGHHHISHLEGDEYDIPMRTVARWQMEQVAGFVRMLEETPNGEGSLLDDTIVLYINTFNQGKKHRMDDLPILLVGGANTGLRLGQSIEMNGRAHNDLYLTIAHAMGRPIDTFGNPKLEQAPIGALL